MFIGKENLLGLIAIGQNLKKLLKIIMPRTTENVFQVPTGFGWCGFFVSPARVAKLYISELRARLVRLKSQDGDTL